METNNKQIEVLLDDKGHTYVFDINEKMNAKPPSQLRRKIWQIFPSVCGSMMCVPFGLMLGWPSPTYPTLITKESPVPISIDQSAMVAGFLMIGNTVTTPLSSTQRFSAKYGIIFGITLMVIGWLLMWQAKDIYWLLGSRFLIGAGNGYATGQLKFYISEICEDYLSQILIKQMNLYTFAGVIVAFAFGPFVEFRKFSIIAVIISIFVLFLAVFLPSTPRDLLRSDRVADAKRLIAFLSPHLKVPEEIVRLKEKMNETIKTMSFFSLLKNGQLRKNFTIFSFAIFFQQFSGAPSTIVYSQILFTEAYSWRPEFCALIYSCVFWLANVYGIFCVPLYNRKNIFLISTVLTSLVLLVHIIVLIEKVNVIYFQFTSLIVMLLFIIVHTIGLGSVPVSLIPDLFPKEARTIMGHYFIMLHSILALIITKIFQVMFDRLGLFAPFCLFLLISTFSIFFVIIFIPKQKKSGEISFSTVPK